MASLDKTEQDQLLDNLVDNIANFHTGLQTNKMYNKDKIIKKLIKFVRKMILDLICRFGTSSGNNGGEAKPVKSLFRDLCETHTIDEAIELAVKDAFDNVIVNDLDEYHSIEKEEEDYGEVEKDDEEYGELKEEKNQIKYESFYDFMEHLGLYGYQYAHLNTIDDYQSQYAKIVFSN